MKILKDDPRAIHLRLFKCQECGEEQVFPKRKNKTIPGHEKDAYCFRCKKTTKWLQID